MTSTRDLVGFSDPKVLAEDIFSEGLRSCSEAEAAGWMVTDHEATRVAVDEVLAGLWLSPRPMES